MQNLVSNYIETKVQYEAMITECETLPRNASRATRRTARYTETRDAYFNARRALLNEALDDLDRTANKFNTELLGTEFRKFAKDGKLSFANEEKLIAGYLNCYA